MRERVIGRRRLQKNQQLLEITKEAKSFVNWSVKLELGLECGESVVTSLFESKIYELSKRVEKWKWRPTLQRDLAKFFLSCSETVAWMFLSLCFPVIQQCSRALLEIQRWENCWKHWELKVKEQSTTEKVKDFCQWSRPEESLLQCSESISTQILQWNKISMMATYVARTAWVWICICFAFILAKGDLYLYLYLFCICISIWTCRGWWWGDPAARWRALLQSAPVQLQLTLPNFALNPTKPQDRREKRKSEDLSESFCLLSKTNVWVAMLTKLK